MIGVRDRMPRRPVVVVLRALGLGDFLTGLPALRAIAEAFPRHRRVLAAPAALAPLVRVSDTVHALAPTAGLGLRMVDPRLGWPQVAINLHGRGPASHETLLGLRPTTLISFAHPAVPASRLGSAWREDEHEVARWCRLLRDHGLRADPTRLDLPTPGLTAPPAAVGAVLLHPGAKHGARRWPAERWAALARALRTPRRPVIVTGSRDEVGLAREVADRAGLDRWAVYAGRTDTLELAALVAAASRVVCGDTGVAHLATALRRPSVVLFGPEPPSRWGPPLDRPWHRTIWKGRRGDPTAAHPDPGLLAIEVEEVVEAVRGLPSEPRTSTRRRRIATAA